MFTGTRPYKTPILLYSGEARFLGLIPLLNERCGVYEDRIQGAVQP